MRICMIGTGYVGLVTGACLSELGNDVWCVDINAEKIKELHKGHIPIYEPGLDVIVKRNVEEGRLHFTTKLKEALDKVIFVFIAVGTPSDEKGGANLDYVFEAARNIGNLIEEYKVIVAKSTIPVGTTTKIKEIISETLSKRSRQDVKFDVAFCPEFLKEGSAVEDFMRPDRIIIGTENKHTEELLQELFAPFTQRENRLIAMSIPSAELTKYASNAMLATRISFMNELARFCEQVGADVEQVRIGMGSDSRIGSSFLYAGIGYGGSCFPKDVKALIHSGQTWKTSFSVLEAVESVNQNQRKWFFDKVKTHYKGNLRGKTFAVWGLSFKPHTDDVRDAPALDIISWLLQEGASVRAYDPVATENARLALNNSTDDGASRKGSIIFCQDNYEALQNADALILLTEWPLFRRPDYEKIKVMLRSPVLFDGRNQFNPQKMSDIGFVYQGIGKNNTLRGDHGASTIS